MSVLSAQDLAGVVSELASITGPDNVQEPAGAFAAGVDGVRPSYVVTPGTPEETAAVLALARSKRLAVIVAGTGSCFALGNRPTGGDIILSTARLNSVIAYEAADLTASVQSGVTLGVVNAMLTEHRQILPLDPPGGDSRTLGGIAAVGKTGPMRLGYGKPRDWVVGMQIATTEGKLIRAGGRVVKNVAGYDLCKLMTGSMGTLGVITELSLKVRPAPAREMTIAFRSETVSDLVRLAYKLPDRYVQPVSVEILSPEVCRSCGMPEATAMFIRVAGEDADVREQVTTTGILAAESDAEPLNDLSADAVSSVWKSIADLPVSTEADCVLRVSVPSSQTDRALGALRKHAAEVSDAVSWSVSPLTGVIRLFMRGIQESDAESIASAITAMRTDCAELGGSLVLGTAPLWLKTRVDVWGEPAGGVSIMRKLKTLFDPDGILNPGRFVDGI